MIKAILYDFDGVIKESGDIKTQAFYSMYLPYGKDVADKVVEHHTAHGGISRYEKFKKYHLDYLGKALTEEQVLDLADQFSELVVKKVISCDYVPGAYEAINVLAKSYEQYVVTGTPQNEINQILDALDISHLFRKALGSPQKKIALSQQILNETKFESSEIVFVGDATTDWQAADHHHFHFVLREHEENEAIFKNHNLIKIKDLANFVEIISKLNSE